MPRNGEDVRRRLQIAALELFSQRGYEETTATEIAAQAGVTERTFFRHFPDKREVLFDGDTVFIDGLTSAVRHAPEKLGPWDTLFLAFNSVKNLFEENRPFTEPRQRLIACNAALQERAAAKTRAVIAALASALCERGVTAQQANLAAQMGMAALTHAVAAWFEDGSNDLSEYIGTSFDEVLELSSSGTKPRRSKQAQGPHRARGTR